MEIFVFVRMGGKHEDMVVKLIDEDADDDLVNKLQTFDARKAKCYQHIDQQMLWGVIESAFGDLVPFNKVVRDLFAKPQTAASMASA